MENSLSKEEFEVIRDNINDIKSRINSAAESVGKKGEDILFLAAVKTQSPEKIIAAVECGVDIIAENRENELTAKYDALKSVDVPRHFIGHLQTNKVKKVVGKVELIQSVDSLHLAQAIDRESKRQNTVTDILIEVNIGGEESKSGVAPDELWELLKSVSILENIRVKGLMTIPPICDTEQVGKFFEQMHKIFIDISNKKVDNICMKYLSMGMSDDFEEAIRHGANIVRIGSAIFGKRA